MNSEPVRKKILGLTALMSKAYVSEIVSDYSVPIKLTNAGLESLRMLVESIVLKSG